MGTELLTPGMRAVLAEAAQLMVAVNASSGPHTTPELFTATDGRIWCLTAVSTLKARLLKNGGPVAVAASAGGRSVAVLGNAVVVDPADPVGNAAHPGITMRSPVAVGQFAVRNAAELTGAVRDLLTGRLGRPLPPRRVAVCIEPTAAALLEGDELIETAGSTAESEQPGSVAPTGGDLDLVTGVPEGLRELADDGAAFVGWTTTAGAPLVLPGIWTAGASRAVVPGSLLEWAGGSATSRASVTRDVSTRLGPTGKQGLMLRGQGVASTDGEETVMTIDVDGVTYWDGIETGVSDGRA